MSKTVSSSPVSRTRKLKTTQATIGDIKPDPLVSAQQAGLRYVSDDAPGIRRKKSAKGSSLIDPEGRPMRDKSTVERIRALAIPPASPNDWETRRRFAANATSIRRFWIPISMAR